MRDNSPARAEQAGPIISRMQNGTDLRITVDANSLQFFFHAGQHLACPEHHGSAVVVGPPTPAPASQTPVRIVADVATNRLIVSAPADKMATIEMLIKELDQAPTSGSGAKIVRLKTADAQQLAGVLRTAIATAPGYGAKGAGPRPSASRPTRGRTACSSRAARAT